MSIDSHTLPACRQERTTRISVGDEVRTIIAEAKNYQPVVEPFPETNSSIELVRHAWVDQSAVIKHLKKSLPVKQLMAWLVENYGYLPDAMILQLYHELVRVSDWKSALLPDAVATELKNLRVFYYPHQLEEL